MKFWDRVKWAGLLRSVASLALCLLATSLHAQFEVETKHSDHSAPARKPGKAVSKDQDRPIGADDVDIDPSLLRDIQHRSLKVRDVETPAFYKMLEHARNVNYGLQKKVAAKNVAHHEALFRQQAANARVKFSLFADLFTHPDDYTGELLTFKGYLRKNVLVPPDPNDPGDVPTYEAWLYPPDGQHNPVVVIFLELPKGMPVGGNIIETVEVSGYFFKIYGYRAQDGLRAAPMIIARTVEWTPRVVRDTTLERTVYFLATMMVVAGMIFVYWTVTRRQHVKLSRIATEPVDFDPRDLQSLTLEEPRVPHRTIDAGEERTNGPTEG